MTLLFIIIWLVLTVVFCLVNSLYVGSIWPTVCYAALSGFTAMGFALYEKMQRQKLLDDVQKRWMAKRILPPRKAASHRLHGSSG